MKILSAKWLLISLLSTCMWGTVVANGLTPQCIDVTPLDPITFCGCTWGAVLYEGEAVIDAEVMLSYGDVMTQASTNVDVSGFGFEHVYQLSAAFDLPNDIVARRGDLLTWQATYGGETVTRTVRALPGFAPEHVYDSLIGEITTLLPNLQRVMFTIPEQGVWTALDSVAGYAETIVQRGNTEWVGGAVVHTADTVWIGGASGILERNLNDGTMTTHDFATDILDMAIDRTGTVWALVLPSDQSPEQLYRYDGSSWEAVAMPITAIRVVDNPMTGGIVVGGWLDSGAIAEYVDGAWLDHVDVPNDVYAVAVDHIGEIWAGTLDNGVYHFSNDGQEHFEVTNGLPTNIIFDIATSDTAVYIAGEPSGTATGTIGRYDLATGAWQTWPLEGSGLPEGTIDGVTAKVSRLAVSDNDNVFAITNTGIHQLRGDSWWQTRPVENGGITVLAANGVHTFAAGQQLHQFDADAFPGVSPVATIDSAIFDADRTIALSGTGLEDEPDDAHIVGWDWMSGETLLCNSASCEIQAHEIETDICADQASAPISFRVQDDEGEWSEAVETTIICPTLPTVTNTPQPTDTSTPQPIATNTPAPTEVPLAVSLQTPTAKPTIALWVWLSLILVGVGWMCAIRIK